MSQILTIRNLTKSYGKIRALTDLSLDIEKGQIFGILGPNGSGKTTTLSLILDLIRADRGEISWFGEPPSKESRKRIGSVIESPNFYPYLTAVQNLDIVARIKGNGEDDIDRVLEMTNLYDRRNSRFKTYSFGMKQRLAIASALLASPEVMILDEPTNGLDPQGIADIRKLILQVAESGTTIILASHLLDEVQKICSHVAVLRKGNKLFQGVVSEVLAVSDSFELASENIAHLTSIIKEYPGVSRVFPQEQFIQVFFSQETDPAAINQYCFTHGVVLTRLAERKRSLEQHFLDLLNHDNDQAA